MGTNCDSNEKWLLSAIIKLEYFKFLFGFVIMKIRKWMWSSPPRLLRRRRRRPSWFRVLLTKVLKIIFFNSNINKRIHSFPAHNGGEFSGVYNKYVGEQCSLITALWAGGRRRRKANKTFRLGNNIRKLVWNCFPLSARIGIGTGASKEWRYHWLASNRRTTWGVFRTWSGRSN